jgi:hypothetical protein
MCVCMCVCVWMGGCDLGDAWGSAGQLMVSSGLYDRACTI